MSLVDELKYVDRLSTRLNLFQKVGDYSWNFRCPICGDSQRSRTKARGYIYRDTTKNTLKFKCHNCSAAMGFGRFLKAVAPDEYGAYSLDCFGSGRATPKPEKKTDPKIFSVKRPPALERPDLPCIAELEEDHPARRVVEQRLIPGEHWKHLYYASNFHTFVEGVQEGLAEKKNISPDPRLVIPVYSREGKLVGVQGRAILDRGARYVTVKFDDTHPMIFGLHRWTPSMMTYMVEGPIDSMFIPNGIGALGSDLPSKAKVFRELTALGPEKITMVFDNEPRNTQIVRITEAAIGQGYLVFVWPETISPQVKDINDLAKAYTFEGDELLEFLVSRTYVGMMAKLKFSMWRKC